MGCARVQRSPCKGASLPGSTHLEVASAVEAAAGISGDALVPIEEEALVALAALEAFLGALGAVGDAGAGAVAGAGAELVVAVGGAGDGWGGGVGKKKSDDFTICDFFCPFPRK